MQQRTGTFRASSHGSRPSPPRQSRNLILAAMIFAVSMTFIDQTIVSIAVPMPDPRHRPGR
jgi:hypothetical protein